MVACASRCLAHDCWTARGRLLRFGGTVIKNVAGYDVSRVLAGSLGMLGVIIDVSLKVLPMPALESTLRFDMGEAQALDQLNLWGGRPLPISASCWRDGTLWLRLSGSGAAVSQARHGTGRGTHGRCAGIGEFWRDLREQTDTWFAGASAGADALWRVSRSHHRGAAGACRRAVHGVGRGAALAADFVAGARRSASAPGRWAATQRCFAVAIVAQGVFTPLTAPIAAIHQRLKDEFDPARIFNPDRMYEGL